MISKQPKGADTNIPSFIPALENCLYVLPSKENISTTWSTIVHQTQAAASTAAPRKADLKTNHGHSVYFVTQATPEKEENSPECRIGKYIL